MLPQVLNTIDTLMYSTYVFTTGGHCEDHEDEKTHYKCSTANRASGNP